MHGAMIADFVVMHALVNCCYILIQNISKLHHIDYLVDIHVLTLQFSE